MEPPQTQHAIQLVGPGRLTHNASKPVPRPGPHQVLAKVEAVGLCFSDLKLLKQFSQHVRKSPIVEGLSADILAEIPSYVPGESPTVPGHEVVCRIIEVGSQVRRHRVGERCLVQTDYRDLRTAGSNAAFGYNFEGGLQEYVLMDERVVIEPPTGERFLIPVSESLGASTIALVEPWACVEDSYVYPERRSIRNRGRLLVVADRGTAINGVADACGEGLQSELVAITAEQSQRGALARIAGSWRWVGDLSALPAAHFDDIVYFGASRGMIEALNDLLAAGGLINIVTCGRRIGEPVSVGIGRVHYGMTRWIGTTGFSAGESLEVVPQSGEIRTGDRIAVIGAAGPMGQMHVIRGICSRVPDIAITAADIDDARLGALSRKAAPLAQKLGVPLRFVNTTKDPLRDSFSYYALLVPHAPLVADAIRNSLPGCLINVFAGIPASTRQEVDLDTYISHRCYMFGTSGSVIEDMKIVLRKVERGELDTDISVDAISGMEGAVAGMEAVENRTLAGKIIVYPSLHNVGLIPLGELHNRFPAVSAKLDRGQWCRAAEEELLRVAGSTAD